MASSHSQKEGRCIAGTIAGGKQAARTNKDRHGDDFYARIGQLGGRRSRGGGFASDEPGRDGMTGRERARVAGAIGGRMSHRPPAPVSERRDIPRQNLTPRRQALLRNRDRATMEKQSDESRRKIADIHGGDRS